MNRTRIDWADFSWNPVKGKCPENCKTPDGESYCYARKIYQRFGLAPELRLDYKELIAPARILKPARVFVCSTMELFHPRIPELWRVEIFNIIAALSSLTFIVLTKRPELIIKAMPDNVWLGVSVTGAEDWGRVRELSKASARVKFVSLEPFLGQTPALGHVREFGWLIVGRLTGHGIKHNPTSVALRWLVIQADELRIPVFLKNSLKEIWGGPLIQEYPKEPGKAQKKQTEGIFRAKAGRTPGGEGKGAGQKAESRENSSQPGASKAEELIP